MLELKHLTQRFGDQLALDDLSFSIEKGELVSLLGPSGCGKTTTIRLIAGFLKPTRGSVWIGGRDVTSLPPELRHAGIVFQSYALFPHLDVFENVAFGLRAAKVPRHQLETRVRRALELVNLKGYDQRAIFELSGGEQQMLTIGRALMSKPRCLMLDEPSLGIAPILVQTIFDKIVEINRTLGLTILLVEQNANLALEISHYGYVLETGRVLLHDRSTALRENDEIKAAYLGG